MLLLLLLWATVASRGLCVCGVLLTFGFDADVMMPLICTSWLTRLLLSSRMLLGPKGWLLYSST